MATEVTQKLLQIQIDSNVRVNAITNLGEIIRVGDRCNPAYGGGNILSIEFSKAKGAVIIRKDCKFVDPAQKGLGEFDCVMISMAKIVCAYAVDEAVQVQQPQAAQVKGK